MGEEEEKREEKREEKPHLKKDDSTKINPVEKHSPPLLSPPPPRRHHDYRLLPPPRSGPCQPCRCLFALLVALILLLGFTSLVVWLVYRPHKPRFTVLGAAVYELNTTSLTTITTTMQFTIEVRNPSRRSDAEYRELSAFVSYRDQAITSPTALPDLNQARKSTVIVSPILGGGQVPVSPEVVSGLAMAQAYGLVPMRWVLQGRLRWRSGVFKSGFYGLYVKCDMMVGLKPGLAGQVPLLGSPECSVEL